MKTLIPTRFHSVLAGVTLLISLMAASCGDADPAASAQSGEEGSLAKVDNALSMGDYVITPAGYFHRSCVYEVGEEATVLEDGRVQVDDGRILTIPPCKFPAHRTRQAPSDPALTSNPALNGWAVSADWTSTQYITNLSAHFDVPAAPSSVASQLIYFFPSLMPAAQNTIIQPVLQYGTSPIGGGQYWALASWYVDGSGNSLHSKLLNVSTGDTIVGTMTGTQCTASGGCTWAIVSRDATISKTRKLTVTRPEAYTVANGGVLEAYNVSTCADLPADGSITFSNLHAAGASGTLTPTWAQTVWNHTKPHCNYSVTTSGNSNQLFY